LNILNSNLKNSKEINMKRYIKHNFVLASLLIASIACSFTSGMEPTATLIPILTSTLTITQTLAPASKFNEITCPTTSLLNGFSSKQCFQLDESTEMINRRGGATIVTLYYKANVLDGITRETPISSNDPSLCNIKCDNNNINAADLFIDTKAQAGGWNLDDLHAAYNSPRDFGALVISGTISISSSEDLANNRITLIYLRVGK
jgi:hypothetical protein